MLQKIIAQFIPIILIFILISSFRKLAQFSNTVLGKLIAISIIMFYTYLDVTLGIFACGIIIFYYQMDIIENMLNMDIDLVDIDPNYTTDFSNEDQAELADDYLYLSNDKPKHKRQKEGMINYTNVNHDKDILINNEKLQDKFRKESCVKNQLVNKEQNVKYEMAEHVFPEIKFRKGVCNPCLKSCDFSIIEQKMNTEKKLRSA